MMDKDTEEAEVLAGCMEVLDTLGIYHWRQNTGAFKTQSGGFFRSSKAGVSDILGILPSGKFLAVECKRPVGGVLSEAQKEFLHHIADNNGIAIVTSNPMTLYDALKKELAK